MDVIYGHFLVGSKCLGPRATPLQYSYQVSRDTSKRLMSSGIGTKWVHHSISSLGDQGKDFFWKQIWCVSAEGLFCARFGAKNPEKNFDWPGSIFAVARKSQKIQYLSPLCQPRIFPTFHIQIKRIGKILDCRHMEINHLTRSLPKKIHISFESSKCMFS